MIYLDNAATTFRKPPQVEEAVLAALRGLGNAGRGSHSATLDASRVIFETRELLAELFGAEGPERIAFSSNATESLNTAIGGLFGPGDHVISTVCEHNSVLRPLYRKEKEGTQLTLIPTDEAVLGGRKSGILDYGKLEAACRSNTKAVVITHASNLTGNVTDLQRIGDFARKHGLLFVVDASQTAGIVPINVRELGIDVLCFTGHKGLLGPQGTGGIYVREGLRIEPLKTGGSGIHSYDREHPGEMPAALEAGTLNGHGIAGLHGALEYLRETGIETIRRREMKLMKQFLDGISGLANVECYGNPDLESRAAIVSINIGSYDSAQVGDALWEEYGIAVRTGAHCAPLMHEALGTVQQGAVRFSFSHYNTEEEVETAIRAVHALAE